MKNKNIWISVLAMLTALSLTACGDKLSTQGEEDIANSNTVQQENSNSLTDKSLEEDDKYITDNQQTKSQVTNSESKEGKEDIKMLKDKVFSEFKEYLEKARTADKPEYYQIIASSRGNGLLTTFADELSDEELKFVESNRMDVRAPLKYSYSL